jgi:hypothetical protein
MNTLKTKEILAAKAALQRLLDIALLPSPSLAEFLASLPSDEEEFEDITTTGIEDMICDMLGFLSSAVQFLLGSVPDFTLHEIPPQVASHMEALVLAALAFDLSPAQSAEYAELLAYCRGKESK